MVMGDGSLDYQYRRLHLVMEIASVHCANSGIPSNFLLIFGCNLATKFERELRRFQF